MLRYALWACTYTSLDLYAPRYRTADTTHRPFDCPRKFVRFWLSFSCPLLCCVHTIPIMQIWCHHANSEIIGFFLVVLFASCISCHTEHSNFLQNPLISATCMTCWFLHSAKYLHDANHVFSLCFGTVFAIIKP